MATPIREQILVALQDKLSGLAAFDGAQVQRSNRHIDGDNLPAINLWDDSDATIEQERYSQTSVTTQVNVETLHWADKDHTQWSTQANGLLAELIKAATSGDRTLDGLADDVAYRGDAIDYPVDGSDMIGIAVVLEVRWRHDIGDPFTNSMG
ncbi:hypothetical protein [Halomonas koreensis]|uniref:Uncharacterized protein n=1 Tax=Halomonas koreensis TaxID=245385 RepID=A0ABU1G2X2_9GAMM|nr:hypothetical protein [Halomonas koreensis]MDR5867298.1 hypothetical protein [Halomonas koreensis]